jgi:hypothetical protein
MARGTLGLISSPNSKAMGMPAKRGGSRSNAGRKPKALRYAQELAAAEKKIVAAAPAIIDALVRAAENGDASAARYLLDRVWGRVKEQSTVLAEDRAAPADHPREDAAWVKREREQDAIAWLEEVRGGRTDAAKLTAQLAEVATKVAWARSQMTEEEWRSFETHHQARLVEAHRIVAHEPRHRWQACLEEFDRKATTVQVVERFRLHVPLLENDAAERRPLRQKTS